MNFSSALSCLKKQTNLALFLSATLTPFSVFSLPAQASVLHNGWSYSIDSFNDSIQNNNVGGTDYEIYSTAVKATANELIFAINSNLSLGGVYNQFADDKHTTYGDLIINPTGASFDAANSSGNLLAIRFASQNDSGVSGLGFFGSVTAKSIATENGLLFNNLAAYNNYVTNNGGNPSNGDLAASDPYFNKGTHVPNVINSGVKIGDINFVSDVGALGLDFGYFGAVGSQTIALSVDRSILPENHFNWVYHINPECNNDVTIGIIDTAFLDYIPEESSIDEKKADRIGSTPEPSVLLGLGMVGLGLGVCRRRQVC
ncbi:MAG: PEP-CTERM sorting domain-containing protein [Okeania sp. SIO2F4]|uniref:XDD3 family exosortase-dependent surface protein n=1 Tax=Okeania sp. SIO2F4 TaxID=2607790 RepID=UPI00142B3F5F|nr:XDD3 family exosortase-dependent surface protein [Okeania sp. SIO2F4]NES01834.1 PEP-CTERM sorting domain-containing protein [Okeania sp. SIO2F4]